MKGAPLLLGWIAVVWLWWPPSAAAADVAEGKICGNIDVRNTAVGLTSLHNCTVVNGYVQISLLDATKSSDFDVSFPLLREITQYLVVYRVTGLYNLGKLFPNLMLIRGAYNSRFPGLALMVHDNLDLREIGLYSLTNITQGSIIISKNPKLCHATTIDWGQIANGVSNDINIIGYEESEKCQGCSNTGCPEDRCWSQEPGRCQFGKLNGCHPLCAGGCDEPHSARHCFACTAYMHDGECIRECPYGLYGHIRLCLTEDECHSLPVNREESTLDDLNTNYIPFDRKCRDECPYGFEVTADKLNCTRCTKTRKGNCQRNCNSFKISDEMLRKNYEYRLHTNCTTIKSLEIEVKYGASEDVERRLEEYIGKVEVILDQLKIIRSYSLTSLNFLRSLYEIRGENTVNKMALVVRGNKNLQKLWTTNENETHPVKILNGTVSFHYNPKLCMSEIFKFGNLSTLPPFSDIEVSTISNGDQFACTVYTLLVETVKIESQSILLQMHKPTEADNLERFLVYFIEASKWNETIETTDCEDSSWKIDDISSKKVLNVTEIFHVITNLEPNTEYIYYVKTYTISSMTSMSSIFRNKTLPSKPSTPQYFSAQPLASSVVELTWKPPSHPHGKLVKYVIKGIHLSDDQAVLDERSYCRNKTYNGNGITHKSSPPTVKTDDTCEKQCEPQKNTVNNVCNTFEHGVDIDSISLSNHRNKFEACTSNILNIFINSKCLAMQNTDDTFFPNSLNGNCTEMWTVSNILNNGTYKDGSLSYFQIQLNENFTSFNLTNLRHYSQYLLSIFVCREVVKQELNLSSINNCSQETLISFRTLENKHADIIDSKSVQHEIVNNHTVNISWDSPSIINSIIHSFQLSYKLIESPNFVSVCITMKEYENAGRSYVFKNIHPGVYLYKIQAVSLYGPGPYTSVQEFNVPYPDAFNSWHLVIMIFICGCVLIVLTGIMIRTYFSRKFLERNIMYNLANNPGYVGIYVEDEWEISREDVEIQEVLGKGSFGTVHKAMLKPRSSIIINPQYSVHDPQPCAVKSVSKTNYLRYHVEFMNEAAIMKKFSEAYHIVKLLGVVTKTSPPLLIMELMGRGDLKTVLVKSKTEKDPPLPTRYIMIRMAAQIADGMAFLEYNKFVHRDLAARNCMVADDMTVKIGDFGMSRQIYGGDYYRKGNKGEMPVRWMAPESLSEGIFTSQSDVWSYGVVIWEMLTGGDQPYVNMSNNEVMAHVLDGKLLTLPIVCPDVLGDITKLCWSWTASKRPRFLNVIEKLDRFLDDSFRSVSFYHTHPADNESPADQSLMSPCTTYEEDVDSGSICFDGSDTVAVYSAFHVDKNKMNNGYISPM